MAFIPGKIIRKLYNHTSLRNEDSGVRFSVKNRLSPATLESISRVAIDGQEVAPEHVTVVIEHTESQTLAQFNARGAVDFPLGTLVTFHLDRDALDPEEHELEVHFRVNPFGDLKLKVSDSPAPGTRAPGALPRDVEDDYGEEIIRARQAFIREQTGAGIRHLTRYSIDPADTRGNIEHFTGAAQVPIGFAGPLLVHGQHAQCEF